MYLCRHARCVLLRSYQSIRMVRHFEELHKCGQGQELEDYVDGRKETQYIVLLRWEFEALCYWNFDRMEEIPVSHVIRMHPVGEVVWTNSNAYLSSISSFTRMLSRMVFSWDNMDCRTIGVYEHSDMHSKWKWTWTIGVCEWGGIFPILLPGLTGLEHFLCASFMLSSHKQCIGDKLNNIINYIVHECAAPLMMMYAIKLSNISK